MIVISAALSVICTVYLLHHQYPKQTDNRPIINPVTTDNASIISKISALYKESVVLVDAVQNTKSEELSTGTGFVFSYQDQKYILTNEHVIHATKNIQVELFDDSVVSVQLIGSDYDLDLAVLKPEDSNVLKGIPAIPLADSGSYQIGESVVAIGFPLDIGYTVTSGIVSATEKEFPIENREYEHLIQTDAAINPGNSGGPLINMNGEVIGVNTAIAKDSQGIAFSIPIDTVLDSLESLIFKGGFDRPFMGVSLEDEQGKVIITSVVKGGPADKAGLKVDDVVISIDDIKTTTPELLISEISSRAIGDEVEITFERKGEQQSKSLTILNKTDVMNLQQ